MCTTQPFTLHGSSHQISDETCACVAILSAHNPVMVPSVQDMFIQRITAEPILSKHHLGLLTASLTVQTPYAIFPQ